MDLNFFLPPIHINFYIQTNLEVNQTQIGHCLRIDVNMDLAHTNCGRFVSLKSLKNTGFFGLNFFWRPESKKSATIFDKYVQNQYLHRF